MMIGVLALDQVVGFELMIPGQIFGMANLAAADDSPIARERNEVPALEFDIRVCGQRRKMRTATDLGEVEICTRFGLDTLAKADMVIVPGTRRFLEQPDNQALSALRSASDRGVRIASFCVGAFTLAAAGLLDGRRATTHWQYAGELARRYPEVDVDPRALFVDEGSVLTSAGVAAGVDLCLHLLRQLAGPDLAGRTARRVVVPAWRDGGQAQYIENADHTGAQHPLQSTVDWLNDNADTHLDLRAIASHAAVSVRTLNRQFRDYLGTTPLGVLAGIRVDRARRLLETTTLSMDHVAERSGFGSHASLRYHFVRMVGVSPQKYRQSYLAAH
ncbi:MAG: helix-turn-helix domain-containing protein [Mycobacterium sp.]